MWRTRGGGWMRWGAAGNWCQPGAASGVAGGSAVWGRKRCLTVRLREMWARSADERSSGCEADAGRGVDEVGCGRQLVPTAVPFAWSAGRARVQGQAAASRRYFLMSERRVSCSDMQKAVGIFF